MFNQKYLPQAMPLNDPAKADITLGQLLSMSAGFHGEGSNPGCVDGAPAVKLAALPRPAGPARRNNDAGYGPPGRVTQWDTLGVVQAGASRSDPEGDLLEEEITQYSCGLWDIDQRSAAVSRLTHYCPEMRSHLACKPLI